MSLSTYLNSITTSFQYFLIDVLFDVEYVLLFMWVCTRGLWLFATYRTLSKSRLNKLNIFDVLRSQLNIINLLMELGIDIFSVQTKWLY
jgi:hypothetical protein